MKEYDVPEKLLSLAPKDPQPKAQELMPCATVDEQIEKGYEPKGLETEQTRKQLEIEHNVPAELATEHIPEQMETDHEPKEPETNHALTEADAELDGKQRETDNEAKNFESDTTLNDTIMERKEFFAPESATHIVMTPESFENLDGVEC